MPLYAQLFLTPSSDPCLVLAPNAIDQPNFLPLSLARRISFCLFLQMIYKVRSLLVYSNNSNYCELILIEISDRFLN
ncbi:MAG: hypothetical protein ACRAVC_02095 [Trichormus sp.]